MNTQGIVGAAGGIAFVGSFKEAKGFPSNGYRIIVATLILVIIIGLSGVDSSPLGRVTRAAAWLMLLGSAIRYIPGLATNTKRKA